MATVLHPLAAFRRQQLLLSDARLSQLEQHKGDLERQRSASMDLDPAGASELRDAINSEMDDAQKDYDHTMARSEKLRTLYWRQRMSDFPPELLCHIFKDVLEEPDGQLPALYDSGRPNSVRCMQRSSAPFALAAVCRRWRAIALGAQSLWTYIYIPVRHATEDDYRKLLATLLAGSQKAALTLVLPWVTAIHPDAIWDMDTSAPVARTLVVLSAESRRWRSIEISIAHEALSVSAMGLFRTVTPQLEHCAIYGAREDQSLPWTPDFPNFLPVAPKLRSFSSSRTNIFPTTRGGPYKVLAELTLSVTMPCVAVWDILCSAAPRLEVLDLDLEKRPPDGEHVIPRPIAFPLLRLLKVHSPAGAMFSTNGTRLSLPVLHTLELDGIGTASLRQWWQHTPLRIERLAIGGGSLDASDAGDLHALANLKHLTLSHCIPKSPFSDALARPRADGHWICPQLESVVLDQGSMLEDEDCEAFIRLFQARKDAHSVGAERAPLALREMTLGWAIVPGWAADQIRYILDCDA